VRLALYSESLVINKPLEIVGEGNRDEIVIEARDTDVISFRSFAGRLAGLTIRQAGDRKGWFGSEGDSCAIDIAQGRLEIEDCIISCQGGGLGAVKIRDGAEPRLHRNCIHKSKRYAVFVKDGGTGLLEDNDIFDTSSLLRFTANQHVQCKSYLD
jgi:hypothetical protein